MRPYEELVDEEIIDRDKVISRGYIASIYKQQLEKFDKIGIGGETENGVVVTQNLIDITNKRLYELKPLLRIKPKRCEYCGQGGGE